MTHLLFAIACRSAEGGPCGDDRDCDVGLVCDAAACLPQRLRGEREEAARTAAETATSDGAKARVAETLQMSPTEAARLQAIAHGEWAVVQDPGVMCFWVRTHDGTTEVVRVAPSGSAVTDVPGGTVFTMANQRCP